MNTIKAIETQYKGYRFRSRLEARWAVFFDALGVKWEYEKEGYDLGEAGWYLPDFWLPQIESFVEVKASLTENNPVQKLYLAGKFTGGTGKNAPHDWRESFGVDFKSEYFSDASELPENKVFTVDCGYFYVGSFSIDLSSGHGGDMGHFEDFNKYQDDSDDEKFYEEVYGKDSDEYKEFLLRQQKDMDLPSSIPEVVNFGKEHETVVDKCLKQIDFADIVFAWLDSEYSYGTLVEIGYARAKGKRVVVGVSNTLSSSYDMWFAQQVADTCVKAKSPREAFDYAFRLDQEEMKAKSLAQHSSKPVGIVYGDPLDHVFSFFTREKSLRKANKSNLKWKGVGGIEILIPQELRGKTLQAANAARSARFEHGEKPNL